ncbi:MAG TPA: sigma-70 family RNA polymerase sigma factor [Candidatus Sulfomarinibacteraceae bacterium]|nr:sigma-70 family RNA polymerase sigma factor [Candidatus Sulfomarinibacteraceae bacterium]
MDEPKLIAQAQEGDLTAYNTLVLHYQDIVYNVAYRIMKDPASADDAAQEAFISAYKAIKSFRGGSFKSWLLRIVTNTCYDELRRRKRRPQSSLDEITEENPSASFMADDQAGPEEQRQQSELVDAVKHCMDELPDEQRIAAVLCDVEGRDYKEIAEIMETSLGTVKSRISRARSKLRDCLQEFRELLPGEYRLNT